MIQKFNKHYYVFNFQKKKIIPHIKLSGVIGNVGKFRQGIDFASQEELIKKAFSIKKSRYS